MGFKPIPDFLYTGAVKEEMLNRFDIFVAKCVVLRFLDFVII